MCARCHTKHVTGLGLKSRPLRSPDHQTNGSNNRRNTTPQTAILCTFMLLSTPSGYLGGTVTGPSRASAR
jgi:hypothetical protein